MAVIALVVLVGILAISINNIVVYHKQSKLKEELVEVDIKWRIMVWISMLIECVIIAALIMVLCNIALGELGIENIDDLITSDVTLDKIFGSLGAVFAGLVVIMLAMVGVIATAGLILYAISITLNIYVAICLYRGYKVGVLYIIMLYTTTIILGLLTLIIAVSGIGILVGII